MVTLYSKNTEKPMVTFKKCPSCNSSRITQVVSDGVFIITCQRCGYQNKRDILQ